MIIGVNGNEANVPNRVGTGQYTYYLLKNWQKTASKKFNFRVYLNSKPGSWLPAANSAFTYSTFGPQKFWTQIALPTKLTLEKNKPDVFFSPAHYTPRFSPIPDVVTVHDLAYLTHPKDFKKRDQQQLTAWTKYSVKQAKKIIAVSNNTKNDLIKFYNLAPEKISVVYNGFDNYRFRPNLPQSKIKKIQDKYQTGDDYLVYLGTLQPRKNVENLIKALPKINQRFPKTKLVIIGKKGWLYSTIFSLVENVGLKNQVVFTDFVPDEEVPFLIAGAKVFVLPSFYEGFGITALEAMACGIPVVVSRVSSLPEVVKDAGLYIDNPLNYSQIGQQINKILSDEKLAQKLSQAGIKQSQQFSWEKCAQETLKIIEEAV